MFRLPFILFLGICTIAQSENVDPPLPDLKEIEVAGPYCGIYSLVACLDVYGIHPPIEELLVPEFVGSHQGSSTKELINAAEKFGMHAKSYSNLTWKELKIARTPMILHFRSTYADKRFNHWVAFLGVEGKLARIIDLPHQLALVPPAELLAYWDGNAIEISDQPITSRLHVASRLRYLTLVAVILGIVMVIHLFWKSTNDVFAAPTVFLRLKRGVVQTGLLLGFLFILGILYHVFAETGLLKNPTAVAEVTRRYYSTDIPEISLQEMKKFVTENSAAILDARYVRDFNRGTIPNARSLPISSNLTERRHILKDIAKDERIVVFCQSGGCGFADEVSQFLKFNDYSAVVIYRGGYREWSSQKGDE